MCLDLYALWLISVHCACVIWFRCCRVDCEQIRCFVEVAEMKKCDFGVVMG